ncbi:MAG: helix-turn-helix domain-containing protein [Gemmatimonadales bacterium]|nr:helix-turn-helix domain-containing protein [Gemmatimonadales bacterium]
MQAVIKLFDSDGNIQSSGAVAVIRGRVYLRKWLMGGEHALREPLTLIRRIAHNWASDGGQREFAGIDTATGVQYHVRPWTTPALLTTADVARELGISPARVRVLARSRSVGRMVGTQWLFTAADVDALRVRKPGRPWVRIR